MPRFSFFILLCLMLIHGVAAQQTTVTGTVVEESGIPLSFVSVKFVGTTIQTATDFNGNFKITTSQKFDSLHFSMIGFSQKTIAIKSGESQEVRVELLFEHTLLDAIILTPRENPAWKIMRNVVKNKSQNDYRQLDYVQYESYTKVEMDVDNVSDKFKENKLFKKLNNSLDQLQMITDENGNEFLPVFISETVSDFYYRRSPKATKEQVKATKITGVGVEDGSLVSQFVGTSFQQFNFYDNTINVLEKDFISPITSAWKDSYIYSLEDSMYLADNWCYKIEIEPKRKQDLAFFGTIYIDSETFALVKVDLEIKKEANLNYLDGISYQEEWMPTGIGPWISTKRRIKVDVEDLTDNWASVVVGSSASMSNFVYNVEQNKKFYDYPIEVNDDAQLKENTYFDAYRSELFTEQDEAAFALIDSVKNIPVVRSYVDIINFFVNGYHSFGKIDVGRYLFMYAYNDVEGHRIVPGFRTNERFSKKLVFKGYTGYTTRDAKIKYSVGVRWILDRKPWTEIGYKITSDIYQLGLTGLLANNFFEAGSRWGKLRGAYYYNENQLFIYRQLNKSFSTKTTFKSFFMDPVFPFNYYLNHEKSNTSSTITQSEIEFEARYAKDELIIVNGNERYRLGSKLPTLTLKVGLGIKDIFYSQFNYQKVDLGIEQNVSLGRIGRSDYKINFGRVYGQLPYPLLNVPIGNQSPVFSLVSFNLMNYFEFVTDQYASMRWTHHFEGFFLNRIPLMKKLKWRMVTTSALLFGAVDQRNLDVIVPENGQRGFSSLTAGLPYAEVGYGIENIFRVFRVQVFHRLTYRDHEGASNFGIRATAQFSF